MTFGCMYRGIEIAATILKSWPPLSFEKEKKKDRNTFMAGHFYGSYAVVVRLKKFLFITTSEAILEDSTVGPVLIVRIQ